MSIFRRDGVSAARIDDIAQAAGVSHGTFYFHFATKEEVLAQCLRASEARVAAVVDAMDADAKLIDVIEAASAAIAREWQSDPDLFPDVAVVALRYISKPRPGDTGSFVAKVLVGRFATASARGELSPLLPPEVLSDLFLINVFAATLSWCANPSRPLDLVLSGVVRIFLDGARNAFAANS